MEPRPLQHTPEPLSGAVANMREFHYVFFTSNWGRAIIISRMLEGRISSAVGNYSITIALLATEPITKLDAAPVAVHRDRVCMLKIITA